MILTSKSCSSGFIEDNGQCRDIDECAVATNCQNNSTCYNSEGSYTCVCLDGFEETIAKVQNYQKVEFCDDIDECSLNTHNCELNQVAFVFIKM